MEPPDLVEFCSFSDRCFWKSYSTVVTPQRPDGRNPSLPTKLSFGEDSDPSGPFSKTSSACCHNAPLTLDPDAMVRAHI